MKTFIRLLIIPVLIFGFQASVMAKEEAAGVSGKAAVQMLTDGNKRFADSKASHRNQGKKRINEVAKGQHPFAIIVSCSDSRVPPEVIFDQGIGDLFIVRLAGNIVDDAALGSIEYAAEHLGAQCIMVLGHERCGAVQATVKGGEVPGHIGAIVKALQPAVDKVKDKPGDTVDLAVRANVGMVVEQLKTSAPILKEMVEKGKLTVIGGRYDLDDGKVEIIQ